jgi:aspartate kinase
MSVRILKFGGTSVGSPQALGQALDVVVRAAAQTPVVVVASAMSGVTDALVLAARGAASHSHDVAHLVEHLRARHLELLHSVASYHPAHRAAETITARLHELSALLEAVQAARVCTPRQQDAIAALGERLSVPVVVAGLEDRGLTALAVDAGDLLRTDAAFGAAEVDLPATRRLARTRLLQLADGVVPVVTGFLGATPLGATTTLGRGGSDWSAAVLGWALGAERVEIWTDVDGVMSADPRREAGAVTLPRLGYAEATRLALAGAKVLHPKTMTPLAEAGIPIVVRNTLRPDAPGTWIGPENDEHHVRVNVVVAGARGHVARSLLRRLAALTPERSELRLVGAFQRDRLAWEPQGIAPHALEEALEAGEALPWQAAVVRLASSGPRPLLLVDCTASGELALRYASLFAAGVGIVTPNKRAGCLPLAEYRRLRAAAHTAGVPWRYATTVGAGLPVLRAVRDLTRSGDRLHSVAAVLSGTLSFVLHRVQEGVAFSAAVTEAQARGLTEPDPRQDLSGEDVARKLLIILREAGLPVEPEDVETEALLPAGGTSLAALDASLSARAREARAEGQRLVVLASYDGRRARVALEAVAGDSAIAQAGPGENVVVLRTDRYAAMPLTLAGPGAGPDVTAANLLTDVLLAARDLTRERSRADEISGSAPLARPGRGR